ncbi:F0F1 ATP synthase subunit delta [Desmospora profundinema]|uniref:ATP synthase subunit delta n=1 Tax=Desmospora profundinema TaxID=1571184 RepID=A0ABU1IL60_9BACL|nr:F0F1 ATP synthase subunit delta [Desmospora profundinema]MDR6225515.1 F-type H+-transporting ATPase subunit delta [Desmospora profundinema]
MSISSVANRYAKALFEAASENGELETVEREVTAVADVFQGNADLLKWLEHPKVTVEEKKNLFDKLFPDVSAFTRNLLHLLVDRGRELEVTGIATAYKHLAMAERGVVEAEVVSAAPLTEADQKALVSAFEKRIGKTIHIQNNVDSDILGGVIVKIGDRLYDGSLKTKLERFRKNVAVSRLG